MVFGLAPGGRGGGYLTMNVTQRESRLLTEGSICVTEFFKNFEPFCMNFRKFHNHDYEFCPFEDATARSIQISSVVTNILKKLPTYQNHIRNSGEKPTHMNGTSSIS